MSAASMRRGAREANEESTSAAMGTAIGNLAVFIRAINDLTTRVEALEKARESEPKAAPADGAAAQDAAQAQDAARLDSGAILLEDRDEFGEPCTRLIVGLDLRAAIDAAMKEGR